jgi:flagellar assembly protein FliH
MADAKVFNGSDEFVPMPTPDQALLDEKSHRLDAVPFEYADIRSLAQRILKRAQEQGQRILETARSQVAAMEKQAYDKAYKEALPQAEKDGFAKGEKNGLAAAEAKIAAAAEAERESVRQNSKPTAEVLEQLAAVMNDNRRQLAAQAENDLLLLSLDMARRLVGHELSVDPDAIRPLVVECIGMVTDRSGITVRINPEDHRVMREMLPELKNIFPDLGAIRIEPDATVDRGGIMAATREAEVDMRLAARLAAFENAMLGVSGEAAAAPWSAIHPEAGIALNQAESPYSLPIPEPAAASKGENQSPTEEESGDVIVQSPGTEPSGPQLVTAPPTGNNLE